MRMSLVLLSMLLTGTVVAAEAPGSDIWLVELETVDGQLAASQPRNLTRRPGYDNQPAFVTDNAFLFTSMDDDGQTDAWRYDLTTDDTRPLLVTPESEYSPTPAPGGDLSVVRVSLNEVQQLWRLAPGGTRYEVVFPMLEGIGYHAWLDEDHVALFVIPESADAPPELHIANRSSGDAMRLAKDIGRSLQAVPGTDRSIAFIESGQGGKNWIKRLDFDERRITPLAPVIEGSEDFAYLPDGRLVMARDKTVFVFNGNEWKPLSRFNELPGSISRLAISPAGKRMAMVVAEGG